MRRILLIAAAIVIAACGEKRVPSLFSLPLLPESFEGEPQVEGMPIFTLAAGGRVLFRGKEISYAAIGSELKALSPAPEVVGLRIHSEEPWIHVQWAVAAIAERDITRARAIYGDGGGGEIELEFTVWPSNLLCVLPVIPDRDGLLLQIAIASDGRFRCGERVARAASELDAWVAEGRARVGREDLLKLGAILWPRKHAPWGAVADAYARLRAAGVPVDFSGYTTSKDSTIDERFFERYRTGGMQVVRFVSGSFTILPEGGEYFERSEAELDIPEEDIPEEEEHEDLILAPEPPLPKDD